MREFNAFEGYPKPKEPRLVGSNLRTIHSRIIASYRDEAYYDGDRINGYGGFNYDGRWAPIANHLSESYSLHEESAVLQVGCEKGFLLHDFHQLYPTMKVRGTDISDYAIAHAMPTVKPHIQKAPFTQLPYEDAEFDFVLAAGVVYTLNLADAISCLKEIQRVSKRHAFITLGAYTTQADKTLLEWWTVLGATILHEEEWVEVLKHTGYTGDYYFTTAQSLNLKAINS